MTGNHQRIVVVFVSHISIPLFKGPQIGTDDAQRCFASSSIAAHKGKQERTNSDSIAGDPWCCHQTEQAHQRNSARPDLEAVIHEVALLTSQKIVFPESKFRLD